MNTLPHDAFDEVLAAFEGSGVLRPLSPEARRRLAKAGTPMDVAAGALICQAGDPGDAAFVVLEGELEVRRASAGGRELRLVALGRGAVAGEMAVLDGGPRAADVAATRRTRLWRIPRAALMEALEAEPKAAVALLVELSGRLRRTNAMLEDRATLDLAGRLAQLLADERTSRGLVALTQSEMARRVGASRERVNRRLAEWAETGWVEVTRAGVRVLQPAALAHIVRRQLAD
jgi:CRP-like cAMP-binding protein